MKRTLSVFLVLAPLLLHAQENNEPASYRLLLKVPVLNAGLSSRLAEQHLGIQNESIGQFMGTGFWYFNSTRFSYQLGFDITLCRGSYDLPVRYHHNELEQVEHEAQRFNFLSPASSFSIHFRLSNFPSINFYPFLTYQLQLVQWSTKATAIAGKKSWVANGVYSGYHYEAVYSHQFTTTSLPQLLHLGVAVMDSRDFIDFRFYCLIAPKRTYHHTTRQMDSSSTIISEKLVRSSNGILIGASIAVNASLMNKKAR